MQLIIALCMLAPNGESGVSPGYHIECTIGFLGTLARLEET